MLLLLLLLAFVCMHLVGWRGYRVGECGRALDRIRLVHVFELGSGRRKRALVVGLVRIFIFRSAQHVLRRTVGLVRCAVDPLVVV